MASRNLDVGSNHNTFLTSFSNRQKNNVTKHTTSEKKQQHASFKEIQSVMTEYTPLSRWFRRKISASSSRITNWTDLDKIMNTKLNLQNMKKQNQDSANKVRSNTTNNKHKESKPSKKKHNSTTLKNLKKSLNGSKTEKLTLLAKIRSLLKRLKN
uniref:Uncharacterized protein n=1 Tax=Rhizophagus irregularis (strain DAOM 181602 / DAOM 197198 / MUCL 43194) TaxID=747089 RepID=U9U759_RHIID